MLEFLVGVLLRFLNCVLELREGVTRFPYLETAHPPVEDRGVSSSSTESENRTRFDFFSTCNPENTSFRQALVETSVLVVGGQYLGDPELFLFKLELSLKFNL